MLNSPVYFNPDCTVMEGGDPVVTKEAEHGSAVFEMKEGVIMPGSKCSGKKMQKPMLIYKASAEYTGTDTFEVTAINSSGMATLYRYTIKIVDTASRKK
jgi:hypothetical protein